MKETGTTVCQYGNWKLSLGLKVTPKRKIGMERVVLRTRLQKGWRMDCGVDKVEQ